MRVRPLDPHDAPARFHPSFDALQERYLRNFLGGRAPKGEVVEGLNVEVILSREEALQGLQLRLEIPTLQACGACDGTGQVWPFRCVPCRGLARVLVPDEVRLRIRPPVASGTLYEIPLDHLGVHNFLLRVHPVVE